MNIIKERELLLLKEGLYTLKDSPKSAIWPVPLWDITSLAIVVIVNIFIKFGSNTAKEICEGRK